MKTAIALVALLELVLAKSKFHSNSLEWKNYKKSFEKSYASAKDEERHRSTYFHSKELVRAHNKRYAQGLVSYSLKLNTFSDRLPEEMEALRGIRYVDDNRRPALRTHKFTYASLPDSVDWRTKNAVTPVIHQRQCSSCWAFSAVGSLEGLMAIKTGKLVPLSKQQLVDCSRSYGNNGCDGGFMNNSFLYIKENGGIESEASYPYTTEDGECSFNKTNVAAKIKGFIEIEKFSEDDLQDAVAFIGPVAAAVDGSYPFDQYHKGIYTSRNCNATNLSHAVVVIGYGIEDGTPYWLIKNSYGTRWGYSGFGKIIRNKNNHCGIATLASYPIV